MAELHEMTAKKKLFSSKLFIYLLFIFIYFHLVQSQTSTEFLLTPSSVNVRVGHISLLLQTSISSTPISCSILETDSRVEANTEIANPSCLSPAGLVETSNWILLTPLFTTTPGNLTRVYTISVEQKVSNISIGALLVTSCCDVNSTSSSSSLGYVDISTYTSIYISPVYNNTVEISFPNPAYTNIAPCPCDLTLGRCNINCCCDQDCSEEFIKGFICIPGPFGGDYLIDDVRYCNTSQSLLGYTWHQFFCIQKTNMAFMGNFYTNSQESLTPLTTVEQFQSKLQSVDVDDYTYVEERSNNRYLSTLPSGYQQNDILYTRESGTTWNKFFSIPKNLGGGECLRNGNVEYLQGSDSVCSIQVTSELCTSGTILDPISYITNPLIFTNINIPVPVEVNYYCVDYTEYERSSEGITTTTSGTSLFPSRITEGEVLLVSCTPSYGNISLATRGDVCRDSVVEVKYELKWKGDQITSVTTNIYLANVTITDPTDTSGLTLTQKFKSQFIHDGQNITGGRSGNPGYDIGLLVLASDNNITFFRTSYLYVWKPVGVGLCVDSEVQQVEFGRDHSSGCIVRLTYTDFTDCDALRLQFESAFQSLFTTSKFVSRFGKPDESGTDGLDIIFDDTTNSSLYSSNATSKYNGKCHNIPVEIIYQFVYSITGMVKGYPIREIVSARIGYKRETLRFACIKKDCDITSDKTVSFPISSSTSFTQIHVTTQQGISPNDRRYDSLNCDRNEVCWGNLFLPLSSHLYFMHPIDTVYQQLERNVIFSLAILFVLIGLFLMSLNWSWIGKLFYQYTPL